MSTKMRNDIANDAGLATIDHDNLATVSGGCGGCGCQGSSGGTGSGTGGAGMVSNALGLLGALPQEAGQFLESLPVVGSVVGSLLGGLGGLGGAS